MALLAGTDLTNDSDNAPTDQLVSAKAKAVLIAIVIATFGLICYGIGTNHGSSSHVLTGKAVVGVGQASVNVHGWWYGFAISPNGMTWYDADGTSHDGGIPPCLAHPGTTMIRFGYADAPGLNSQESQRVVTWTQCVNG